MLTDYQIKEIEHLMHDEMDFLYEIASKYGMTTSEVRRLCFFMGINYASLQKHTLEPSHVQH